MFQDILGAIMEPYGTPFDERLRIISVAQSQLLSAEEEQKQGQ